MAVTDDPDVRLVPLAVFDGFLKRWTGNARDDHLELTLGVKRDNKYDAMPVTDRPGRMLRITVEMVSFEGEE